MDRPNTREIWTANAPAWIELSRAGYDVYRDLVNTPTFLEMLPSVRGLRCLDLGCGEGHNTRLLDGRGAEVIALDVAWVFIQSALEADAKRSITYVVGDGAVLPFRSSSFDVVTAFMSLMDVADPEQTLRDIARVVRPGGILQFSVLHPVVSTPIRKWVYDDGGRREALAIGGYFKQGPVTESWTFSAAPPEMQSRHRPFEITYARRTVSGWLNAVIRAGFSIKELCEPHADEVTAAEHPEVADTRIAPYSLIVQATRT